MSTPVTTALKQDRTLESNDLDAVLDADEKRAYWVRLQGAVKSLAPRQQQVITMYQENEGITSEEIAERLNIDAAAVRSAHSQAMSNLRQKLSDLK